MAIQREILDGLIKAAGVDGAREIINAYRRSSTDLINQLDDLIESRSLRDAGAVAHALKGSSANVGAIDVSTIAADIETRLRNEELKDLDEISGALRASLADALIAFNTTFESA